MTYTVTEVTAIAHECASFAQDNFDREDLDGFNSALTPTAMWDGWHSKEGVEAPEMPAAFASEYLYQCERIGGSDFSDDIAVLISQAATDGAVPQGPQAEVSA